MLTGYMIHLLNTLLPSIEIITPLNESERGAQLSLYFPNGITEIIKYLSANGVVFDERKPNVIRVAPAPLYNTFEDVWNFINYLCKAMK
jgi:kynureninase